VTHSASIAIPKERICPKVILANPKFLVNCRRNEWNYSCPWSPGIALFAPISAVSVELLPRLTVLPIE
jgi:hypothetical protein